MGEFTFYRQARADGGIRTGLECGAETIWETFENEAPEEHSDPALEWFVDVRGKGADVPGNSAALVEWLHARSPRISARLRELAQHFELGADREMWPVSHDVSGMPPGTEVTIVVNASRRTVARDVGRILRGMARKWRTWFRGIAVESPTV